MHVIDKTWLNEYVRALTCPPRHALLVSILSRNGSTLTNRHTDTDGTNFIPSIAGVGEKTRFDDNKHFEMTILPLNS